jgi:hypothetical protein
MPGLDPGIRGFAAFAGMGRGRVDGRTKSGHDDSGCDGSFGYDRWISSMR